MMKVWKRIAECLVPRLLADPVKARSDVLQRGDERRVRRAGADVCAVARKPGQERADCVLADPPPAMSRVFGFSRA